MKRVIVLTAAGFLLLGVGAPVQAELSANVALTSDYVWRGISQSDEDPAIQGGFDFTHQSGFYAGAWGSNVDFNETGESDPADLELDIYAGFSSEFRNGMSWDVGVIRYMYPGASADLDWTEVYVGAGYGGFSGSINYSNDALASDEDGFYYNLGYEYGLPQGFGVHAGVGYYDVDDASGLESYAHYSLGVNKELGGVGFDLTFHDTDSDGEDAYDPWGGNRFVFTVSKEF